MVEHQILHVRSFGKASDISDELTQSTHYTY